MLSFFIAVCFQAMAQGFSPETRSRLQHVIDSFQINPANPYIGGISAAIKVDGLAFWQGTTGYAARNVDGNNNLLPGGSAFTTATVSQIYSVTKTFTSALVLELAKEGSFGLEDPISMYLPLNLINPGLNSSVTIRQLLAHESGYSNYTDEYMLQLAVAFQPTHVWTAFEMLTFVHQVKSPGAERRYSSTNYIVLGAIVEAVTGKPIQQHYRERFFHPLGLNSMFLSVRESLSAGVPFASPHDNLSPFNPIFQLTGQPVFPDAYTNVSAFPFTAILSLAFTGGGIASNAGDLAEWGNALFGGRATSKATLNTMLNSISSTPDEDGDFLGYGIFRTTKISSTDRFIGHDGNAPGYRSVMFYQPDRKMTIAILTNYGGAKLYEVAKALYEAMPPFICGSEDKKEVKIIVCSNNKSLCVDREAATVLIQKGAYLGGCEETAVSSWRRVDKINTILPDQTFIHEFPNPSSGYFSVSFKAQKAGNTSLGIYDMNGKLVLQVINGYVEKGTFKKIDVEAGSLIPGTYIGRLKIGDTVSLQKIVLSK